MKVTSVEALNSIANKVSADIIDEIYYGQSGHPGGALSIADILTVLYFNEMNIDAKKPYDEGRDRFVLSKGHASAALYAVLAEKGYFNKEILKTFRNIDSPLQGHPDMNKVFGVDMTTGSLGQGLSVANGMAINSKMKKMGYRVYCMLGDGEIQEGQVWEAAMTSVKYNLDNLCVIVDCNNIQLTGSVQDIKKLNFENIEQKFSSFGFNTMCIDGHNIDSIIDAFQKAEQVKDIPTAIIARTIKGKGISFVESAGVGCHNMKINKEQLEMALKELI